MSVQLWVEVVAAALALWAVALSIPRPPALAWERLFKVGLSVVTAGEVERAHGAADEAAQQAWADRVLGPLAWHPAGRDAERKLAEARVDDVPVPARAGERALVEALAALPDAAARYRRMFVEDEHARGELLGDPTALGQDHDPAHVLGPDAGWDEVAAWSPALQAVLARRLDGVVLVLDGLDDALAAELGAAVPGLRVVTLPALELAEAAGEEAPEDAPEEAPADAVAARVGTAAVDALFAPVEEALTADSDRLVLVAAGVAVQRTLAALVAGAGLRDRTLAVVSLGGAVQVPAFQPWLDAHFDAEHLDTELRRSVPFMHVVDVDPADPLATPWRTQRFPVPAAHASGRAPVDVVDLGPMQCSAVEPRVLARGLILLLALRLSA